MVYDLNTFGQDLMKAVELNKELEVIETELEKCVGLPVCVYNTAHGHIALIDYEKGLVHVEFGLRSGTDYGIQFIPYSDFVIGKVKVEHL